MFEPVAGPSTSVDDLLRVLDAAAAAARLHTAPGGWSGEQRRAVLARVGLTMAALTTVKGRVLVAERDAAPPPRPGERSFADSRAAATRQGRGEVTRELNQADTLDAMPQVAGAVDSGRMPSGHLDALSRLATGAPEPVRAALTSAEGQRSVLGWADRMSAPQFARHLAGWAASLDPGRLEDDFQSQRRERFLFLTHRREGTYLKGRLDPMAGHALRLALEGAAQVPDGTRSPAQAAADALTMIAEHATACGSRPAGDGTAAGAPAGGTSAAGAAAASSNGAAGAGARAGAGGPAGAGAGAAGFTGVANRPHVSLIMNIETLAALREAQRRAAAGNANGDAGAGIAPATLEDGTPVPMSEVARILCDCEITRIAIDADSVPVDLGRTARLYSGAQRRAVIARDRHCAWNGCDAPARWCQIHHITWWDRDRGRTSLLNGVLLCSYHHHEVHRHDLTLLRLRHRAGEPAHYEIRTRRDGRIVSAPAQPTGTDPTTPRGESPRPSGGRASDPPRPSSGPASGRARSSVDRTGPPTPTDRTHPPASNDRSWSRPPAATRATHPTLDF